MGGGKGNIDHYVTPIRSGRIIIEVAGHCEYKEVCLYYFNYKLIKKSESKGYGTYRVQHFKECKKFRNKKYLRGKT